uniref:Uncharacterized protein n=1 Tax=Daphnia galeata TaxID=27404 RepID=A0A8J2WD87_9CRUS|nr:unnamed protein product [Daphnia galeata]
MEQNDQNTILRSLVDLTKLLDLNDTFLSLLQQKFRVFSSEMIEDILKNDNPQLEFCFMLVKRGPNAFKNFVGALQETNQSDVLRVLELTRSTLDQPPSLLIPSRESNAIPIIRRRNQSGENRDTSHGDFSSANVQHSSSLPACEEYRRKVLQPARYVEVDPFAPIVRERSNSYRAPPVTDALPPDYNLLDIRVTIGEEIKGLGQDIYPNRHISPRGLALIMNFEKFNSDIVGRRIGSEKDVIHLDQLLQQLGYKVIIKSDLTWIEMNDELELFTKSEDHNDADSVVVAVMSHGKSGTHDEGTLIYTKDCKFFSSEDLLRRFNNLNCPLLKGKPKIFFFQFCRGDNIDFGHRVTPVIFQSGRTVTDGNAVPTSPTEIERSYGDMLITYSTLPGYVSYREESEGTWFIKALSLTFMRDAHECHVDRLLQIVDEQIRHWTGTRNGKQTLEIIKRGFNRKFYFNPGLWQ